jgi:L-fuconolactonase
MLSLCARHPDLPVVIDHAAKPDIAGGAFAPWASDIARVARETACVCKVSGLVTEAARDWRAEDLRRYADHLLDVFGPRRLMWGSDWPVVELAGGYARWRATSLRLLNRLDADEQQAVLGGTATEFYELA